MGRFKRFLKYRAIPYLRIMLMNKARLKLPILLLTLGVGLLGSPWLPLLFTLLARTSANVTWLDGTISLSATVIGVVLVVCGLILAKRHLIRLEKSADEKTNAIIKQYSINSSEKNDTSKNPKRVTYAVLDQRKKEQESEREWIERAILKQKEIVDDVHYIVERWDEPILHYEGIAHIPFVFLLGYQLSDKRDIVFSEWDENIRKWKALPQSAVQYPPLILHKNLVGNPAEQTEVAICVSLTEEIYPEQLKGLSVYDKTMYHLKLGTCERHAIKCKDQLAEYTVQFRKLVDDIKREHRQIKTIHVFISAQTSLVYCLGGSLTRNDPEVLIHNYNRGRTIEYSWALMVKEQIDTNRLDNQIYFAKEDTNV